MLSSFTVYPADEQTPQHLDLSGQLNLLQELGVVDFLKSRYSGLDSRSFENKLAEILCLITGENTDQKKTVLQILSSLNWQGQKQPAKGADKQNASENPAIAMTETRGNLMCEGFQFCMLVLRRHPRQLLIPCSFQVYRTQGNEVLLLQSMFYRTIFHHSGFYKT